LGMSPLKGAVLLKKTFLQVKVEVLNLILWQSVLTALQLLHLVNVLMQLLTN
jgi:hypothetical protein